MKRAWKSIKRFYRFVYELFDQFTEDKCFMMSAALAYYSLFSLPPMLTVVFFITFSLGKGEAIGQMIHQLVSQDKELAEKIMGIINEIIAKKSPEASLFTLHELPHTISTFINSPEIQTTAIIGFVVVFIGATTALGNLHLAFNHIWGVDATMKIGFLETVQQRFLAFALLGIGSIAMLAVFILVDMLGYVYDIFNEYAQFPAWLVHYFTVPEQLSQFWQIVYEIPSLLLMILFFALLFKVLSDAVIRWKYAWWGSVFTTALFFLGQNGVSLYLSGNSMTTFYGAAGSLLILLFWLYYSAMIILLGAEFIKILIKFTRGGIGVVRHATRIKNYENSGNEELKFK